MEAFESIIKSSGQHYGTAAVLAAKAKSGMLLIGINFEELHKQKKKTRFYVLANCSLNYRIPINQYKFPANNSDIQFV